MESLRVLNSRYQLLSIIKRSDSGTIYRGHDSVLGKDIAVKEISRDQFDDASQMDRLHKRVRQAAKMNHQNMAHVFDSFRIDGGDLYVVMEYVDGLDLAQLDEDLRTRGQEVPEYLAVHLVAEVSKALDYGHNFSDFENQDRANCFHGNISPRNVMIARSGAVKLTGFGMAPFHESGTGSRDHHVHYLAPEYFSESAVDKRSDIFSLGLILYELLEGKRFLSSESPQDIRAVLNSGNLKLRDSKKIPKPLQLVLHKALSVSVEGRYQNANQFYIDLVTYLVLNKDTGTIDAELANLVAQTRRGYVAEGLEPAQAEGLKILFDEPAEPFERPENDDALVAEFSRSPGGSDPGYDNGLTEESTIELVPPDLAPSSNKTERLEDGDDDVKTVIDIVRLATRGHKKSVMKGTAGVVLFLALFAVLDFSLQWTSLGAKAYDFVFPPAIRITSIPPGAKVLLNDEALPGVTPISLDKIKPDVYELKLTAEGYEPIMKSMFVPSKGQIEIKGASSEENSQEYLFRFKTSLQINSVPEGAEVYINDVKFVETTPCSISWEVGESCRIELRKPGFGDLHGFSLDTEGMVEQIDDRRFWDFEVQREPRTGYKIYGKFGKFVTINSNPAGALFYVDSNSTPVGTTGGKNPIFLTATDHKIRFEKKGYNSRVINIRVDEDTPPGVFARLTHPVNLTAVDATNGKAKDLRARITKIVRQGETVVKNKKTPLKVNLYDDKYEVHFSKPGFTDVQMTISPADRAVTAQMEPIRGRIYVVIVDRATGMPVENVEVKFKSVKDPEAPWRLLNVSDAEGTCNGSLRPGSYLFSINKDVYNYQEKTVKIHASDLNLVEFTLSKIL